MKEKLIQLFEEVQIPIAKFNKQNYEISFQNQYETYRELFEESPACRAGSCYAGRAAPAGISAH